MRWEYRAVALWPRLGEGADAMNDSGDVTSLLNAFGADDGNWRPLSGWTTQARLEARRSRRS